MEQLPEAAKRVEVAADRAFSEKGPASVGAVFAYICTCKKKKCNYFRILKKRGVVLLYDSRSFEGLVRFTKLNNNNQI